MKFKDKHIHLLFKIGVWIKGIDGVLETVSGVLLFISSRIALIRIVDWLTAGELQEDPNDFVANHLVNFFHHLSLNSKHFASIYLLVNGAVKIGLAVGLLRGKLWAYPTALTVLGLLLCYQIYRLSHTHSYLLAFATVVDIAILVLIWRDYRYLKTRNDAA